MTKPSIVIVYEQVPDAYSGSEIWIVIHAKQTQNIAKESISQLISATLKGNEWNVGVVE